MSEQRWKPSVTVAAIVERDGRYLLVEEMTSHGLLLNNPAGHLDPGESLLAGAIRETLEETARPFEPEALVGVYLGRHWPAQGHEGDDFTYLRFAFCGPVGEPIAGMALDHPVVRTLWLTLDELRESRPRHRGPLVLQCIEDHHAGQRFALETLRTHPSVSGPQA